MISNIILTAFSHSVQFGVLDLASRILLYAAYITIVLSQHLTLHTMVKIQALSPIKTF